MAQSSTSGCNAAVPGSNPAHRQHMTKSVRKWDSYLEEHNTRGWPLKYKNT